MVTKTAIDQLPSLPQVLLQILDAIHSDQADYQSIAKIVRHDTAVTAKLIAVANSSFYGLSNTNKQCDSIERALLILGTDAVKTVVITTSIKQFFNHFNQKHNQFLKQFWHRSLVCANFAQVLATLTSYPSPDEAYLCGLLTDVGQLILLTEHEQAYLDLLTEADNDQKLINAEQQNYAVTHCQLSSDLIESWQISGFMADAARYHHEPCNSIADAHHLVKIINLASQLSTEQGFNDKNIESAHQLFGLNESLTRELRTRIAEDVDNIANSLGIDIGDNDHEQQAHQQLGQRLGELGELAQVNNNIWQARSKEGLENAIKRSLLLTFGINNSVLFLYDGQQNTLTSQKSTDQPTSAFTISAQHDRSIISDAQISRVITDSQSNGSTLKVIDRQLLSYCDADILVCLPLIPKSAPYNTATDQPTQSIGVLAIGVSAEQLATIRQREQIMAGLCSEIAEAISSNQERLDSIQSETPSAGEYEHHIREAVHEASNPLSIIRNYLETLRIQLGSDHNATDGLDLIKDEIDRVGNILLRLKDPKIEQVKDYIDINLVIEHTAKIFHESLCNTKNITIRTQLDPEIEKIHGHSEHLKQILTNLVKNAVEALPSGGNITISSEASISVNGKDNIGINVEDDGPGISPEIKSNLFSAVTSTKGAKHSGIGLNIVKKLIDDMDGSIVCRSNSLTGTKFHILLPK